MFRTIIRGMAGSAAVCAWLSMTVGCGGLSADSPEGDAGRGKNPGSTSGSENGDSAPGSSGAGTLVDGSVGSHPRTVVSKVDLLFDIDNSASMGDKQAYLSQAIPDLVRRLVSPNCVDAAGNASGETADTNGHCVSGTAEFQPVHDMHIGIVSSSLGPRLGDRCPTTGAQSTQTLAGGQTVNRHNDDQGHLLDRGSDPSQPANYTETPVSDAGTANFLNWFPAAKNAGQTPSPGAPPIGDSSQIISDFEGLVTGTHAFGCGIESQLESWYRFLVQPDPYASLTTSNGFAQWQGIDTVLLAQRADFLRPDSLVAVIVLSDENDSEVDVRSFSGTAWNFMAQGFNPPRGTSVCLTNPNDPGCTSCAFGGHSSDPECEKGPHTAPTDWGADLNLRHVHQKQKYGVSVQFPIQRYVLGLTSPKVPNRDGEYPQESASTPLTSYQGLTNLNCSNPLFAAKLPAPPAGVDPAQWQPTAEEVCNLAAGSRTAGSIYYSHIGGVPHQLLQVDPSNPDSPQKDTLSPADWTAILGKDPQNFDYAGIDPHMIESFSPRTGATVPSGTFAVSDPTAPEGTDPISGREWITDSTMAEHQGLVVDREYACIFKLATPRQCDDASIAADPTLVDACECETPMPGTGAFTHAQVPAVCNDATPTQQDSAKAYPTIRELLLAQLLGQVPGANEGVISSLCPIHTVEAAAGDPLFGYRPAINAIVGRLKNSL